MPRALSSDAGGRSGASACTTSAGAIVTSSPARRPSTAWGYICDLDGKRFTDRDVFVAHLRTAHHTAPARIPELLLMDDGRIHFLGEQTAATGQLTDIAPVFPLLADLEALSRESALDG